VDDNPFEDIVPRITAAERREQQKAREEARREAKEAKKNARRKATKYVLKAPGTAVQFLSLQPM
jgi:peptidyl-prolyl cis-trans isomerase SDCCAG10